VQGGNVVYLPDDDVSTTYPLNFNFDFYCTTYNQVRIGSNGFITFDFGQITLSLTPLAQHVPHPANPNATIAWNWNDLDPSVNTGGGTISYTTIGVSPDQQFIVTYSAVPIWTNNAWPSSLVNTGQIILHETTNIIEIHIKEATNNGWLNHTEGIEDAAGTVGLAVPSRNQTLWKAFHSSHMFAPFSVASTLTASGTPSLCQGTTGQFTVNATPAPQYYTWTFPSSWSGGGSVTAVSATVGSAGIASVVANYSCGASEQATVFVNAIPAPTISFSAVSPTNLCAGLPVNVFANGASTYTLNPGNYQGANSFTALSTTSGIYTLTGTSSAGCKAANAPTVFVNVKPSPTVTVNSGEICLGNSFVITPTGAFSYEYIDGFPVMQPSAPGIYSVYVVGMGTNFCKSAPVASIFTVNALPNVVVAPTRSYICRGETTTLTATGAVNYQWQHNQASNNPVIVSPTLMTTYVVTGMDEHGCVNEGKTSVTVSSCVGLDENVLADNRVTVFPNPAGNKVRVLTHYNLLTLELRDLAGKVIYSRRAFNPEQELDLSDLATGVYLYFIQTPEGNCQGKFIRE